MRIIDVQQGSEEWLKLRSGYRTASEASSMMGVGHTSRNDLLDQKFSGIEPDHSDYTRNVLFARGHEIEAKARPIAEAIIGAELFPATGVDDGMMMLASFDGITMDESVIWECKSWNAEKVEEIKKGNIPISDYWQVVHQLYVSGADECLYMVTDGTEEHCEHIYLHAERADFDGLVSGWNQFTEDLASHTPRESKVEAVGRSPDQLPALHIEVKGAVTASNLTAFKDHALAVFDSINTDLQTDNDFANAEKTTTWCKNVESKLDAAKDHALAQTASIDELFKAIDSIKEEARAKRLELEKLVKARKESIRKEIIASGQSKLAEHVAKINASLDVHIQAPRADFAGAIKGKRTISSLHDSVNTLLAQSKIAANESADLVRANLKALSDNAAEFKHLFADYAQLVTRETDHVKAVISSRIAEHKEVEQKRLDAERARIRAEEEAKARQDAEEAKADPVKPSVTHTNPAPDLAPKAKATNATTTKAIPTDRHILMAVAERFSVSESVALEWIGGIDVAHLKIQMSKEAA